MAPRARLVIFNAGIHDTYISNEEVGGSNLPNSTIKPTSQSTVPINITIRGTKDGCTDYTYVRIQHRS